MNGEALFEAIFGVDKPFRDFLVLILETPRIAANCRFGRSRVHIVQIFAITVSTQFQIPLPRRALR